MAGKTSNYKPRLSRICGAAVIILLVTFGADHFRREMSDDEYQNLVVSGSFRTVDAPYIPEPSTEIALSLGSSADQNSAAAENIGQFQIILPESTITEGMLTLHDASHPVKSGFTDEMVSLLSKKNEYYSLNSESIMLQKDAAEALNRLMEDYNEATGLSDFVVYGTTDTFAGEGSCCPENFPESQLGTTVDLALKAYGDTIAFDGNDEESWIIENCWKYGYILRFPQGKDGSTGHSYCPWHLRFVGKAHSALMHDKQLSLEEYLPFISAYTAEDPLAFTYNAVDYKVFGVESTGESTIAFVPSSGSCSTSGNSESGFIITVSEG